MKFLIILAVSVTLAQAGSYGGYGKKHHHGGVHGGYFDIAQGGGYAGVAGVGPAGYVANVGTGGAGYVGTVGTGRAGFVGTVGTGGAGYYDTVVDGGAGYLDGGIYNDDINAGYTTETYGYAQPQVIYATTQRPGPIRRFVNQYITQRPFYELQALPGGIDDGGLVGGGAYFEGGGYGPAIIAGGSPVAVGGAPIVPGGYVGIEGPGLVGPAGYYGGQAALAAGNLAGNVAGAVGGVVGGAVDTAANVVGGTANLVGGAANAALAGAANVGSAFLGGAQAGYANTANALGK